MWMYTPKPQKNGSGWARSLEATSVSVAIQGLGSRIWGFVCFLGRSNLPVWGLASAVGCSVFRVLCLRFGVLPQTKQHAQRMHFVLPCFVWSFMPMLEF